MAPSREVSSGRRARGSTEGAEDLEDGRGAGRGQCGCSPEGQPAQVGCGAGAVGPRACGMLGLIPWSQ